MTTLCGHERDALIWALTDPDSLNNAEREKLVIVPIGGPVDFSQCVATPKQRAAVCVHDPAKLAEMLAERGRELGLSIAIYDNHRRFRMSGAPVVYALLVAVDGVSIQDRDKRGWDLDMPQARAILLQWLQLLDGAHEEALRVLRGEP